MQNKRWGWLLPAALAVFCMMFFIGCGDDDDDDSNGPATDDDQVTDDDNGDDDQATDDDIVDDDATDDDTGDDDTIDLPQYLTEREYLTDWSSWYEYFDHADPYPIRRLGALGVGNGRVFSLLAANTPFNTLHNLQAPNYQRHLKFFSDKRFTLLQNGEELAWDREYAYRVRGTGILVLRQETGDLRLWTIVFPPEGEGIDGTDKLNSLVQMMIVQNRGYQAATDLALRAETVLGSVKNGLMTEKFADDQGDLTGPKRRMVAGFADAVAETKDRALELPVGDLAPNSEFVGEFVLAFQMNTNPESIYNTIAGTDPDTLLEATYNAWKAFTAEAAKVTTGDELFNDMIEGMSYTVKVQTTDRGAVSQMSEYTGTWARDIMGPAKFYPLISRSEDYLGMLDFYWKCALERGNISNSMSTDTEFTPGQPEPDWENLPEMSGRTAAEGPSYVVLHYKHYLDATGDWSVLEERYGMLRHSLIHQQFREGCLLPFSGDETFRLLMAVAFGRGIFDEFGEEYYSANSSFLFVAAAEFMETVATHFGYTDDAAEYADLAEDVRDCTEQYYWLADEGYYSPIVNITTLEPGDAPYEDVNTKPLWIGYFNADDEQAKENVVNMWAEIGHDDGYLYSPMAPNYAIVGQLMDIEKGIVTGMNYGYSLDNLARLDHPMAEQAFLNFAEFFHNSGNVSEGQIVDDFGRFMYLIEPFGIVSDLTARFRSWEGPIDAAAALQYLFGLNFDATENKITLAPHLPAGWTFADMENVKLGDATFDIHITDDGTTLAVTVENLTGTITVDARMATEGDIDEVRVNGEAVSPTIEEEWGRSRALLPGLTASTAQPLTIEIDRAE